MIGYNIHLIQIRIYNGLHPVSLPKFKEHAIKVKVKEAYLYSADYELLVPVGTQIWHVLTRDHTALPATHTRLSTSGMILTHSRRSVAGVWLILISPPAEDKRLSWPG